MNPLLGDDEFNITVLSNASLNLMPNNTLYNFTNVFTTPFTFPRVEGWCVALHSVSLSTNLVENQANINTVKALTKQVQLEMVKVKKSRRLIRRLRHQREDRIKLMIGKTPTFVGDLWTKFLTEEKPVLQQYPELLRRLKRSTTERNLPLDKPTVEQQNSTFEESPPESSSSLEDEKLKRTKRLTTELELPTLDEIVDGMEKERKVILESSEISRLAYDSSQKLKFNLVKNYNPIYVDCCIANNGNPTNRNRIGSFKIKPSHSEGGVYHFTNHNLTYYPINKSYIPSICIKICDNEGHLLKGEVGAPTVVALRFKKMEEEKYEYYTHLVSNAVGDDPLNFHTMFPPKISAVGSMVNKWEVALLRFNLIADFVKYPLENAMHLFERDPEGIKEPIQTMDENDFKKLATTAAQMSKDLYHKLYHLEANYLLQHNFTIEDIADEFNILFKKHAIPIDMHYNVHTRKMHITSFNNIILSIPVDLAGSLGFMENARYISSQYVYVELTKSSTEEGKFEIVGAFEVNLSIGTPQTLLLYTSCVEPSIVGNVLGQYLTHVPFENRNEKIAEEFVSLNPEYHRLNTTSMERINFKIFRTDGRKLEFATKGYKHRIFFTLIFRRKRE